MFSTIEQAIEDFKTGKMVIAVDDENRENEGDFMMAAELVTPDLINVMATKGRGLICAPVSKDIALKLQLTPMVDNNNSHMHTAFTVSIDSKLETSTGISTFDRAKTLRDMTNTNITPDDFMRPGHIFPLIARDGGVLVRDGHTEACVDLCELAGLTAAGVICEILNPDGTMARLPELTKLAKELKMSLITIEALAKYKKEKLDKTERGSYGSNY